MAYTKNYDPWTASDKVTTAVMDNFETIYTEIGTYITTHTHDTTYYTKSQMESTFWYGGNDGPGSGSDADLIYHAGGNLHLADFAGLGITEGLVVMWYGSVASIPSGWHLCDGTSGTINLVNRFVVGAGGAYDPGDTGGSMTFTAAGTLTVDTHTITNTEMYSHQHSYVDSYVRIPGGDEYSYAVGGSGGYNASTFDAAYVDGVGGSGAHGHSAAEGTTIVGDAVNLMPYCYAVCYIQKLA